MTVGKLPLKNEKLWIMTKLPPVWDLIKIEFGKMMGFFRFWPGYKP